MAKQVINLGASVNDGTGDALRVGAQKINANFTELYNLLGDSSGNISIVSSVTAGPGLIASSSTGDITLTAQTATVEQLGIIKVGTGLTITDDGVLSSPVYSLPRAATNILGGIKVGNNLSIDNDGVLSAATQTYTLPTASISTLGGIRIGTGLTIENGTVSVVATDIASALVSGPVSVSLEDNDTAGILTASGDLSIVSKDAGNYLRIQHVIDTETPNLRNVLEVNNLGTIISSYDEQNELLGRWTFGNDGVITLPNSGIIDNSENNIELRSTNNINFEANGVVNVYTADGNYQWQFGDDGNITLPLNGDILNSEGNSVLLPTIIDTLTNGEFEASLGSNGVLSVPGSIGSLSSIELQATTDASIVAGTDLKLYADGLFALRNYSTEDSIAITVNYNDASQKTWLFNNDGSVTFPDASVQSSAAISLIDLKTIVASSTSFEDFQAAIAAL